MLGLPKTTEMSKQLPKKAVYAKFHLNTAAKEKIDSFKLAIDMFSDDFMEDGRSDELQ